MERNTYSSMHRNFNTLGAMKKEIDAPRHFHKEWGKDRRGMPQVQPLLLPP